MLKEGLGAMTEPTFIIAWRFPGNQVNRVESRFLPEVSKIQGTRGAYLDKPSDKGLPVTARVVFTSKAARTKFMNCQAHLARIVDLARQHHVLDEDMDPRATSTQFYEPVDGYDI